MEIPVLKVFDLTGYSANMRLIRQGAVSQPQDLQSEILPDVKIQQHDLTVIEKEANKKKRQRNKDKQAGEMISPLATNRASQ